MNSPTKANAIDNKPYLKVIKYRIGRYAVFRNEMLDAVNRELPGWSAHDGEDYGVALIEMWAYLADILAYYQERIANEAFIRTAVLRSRSFSSPSLSITGWIPASQLKRLSHSLLIRKKRRYTKRLQGAGENSGRNGEDIPD